MHSARPISSASTRTDGRWTQPGNRLNARAASAEAVVVCGDTLQDPLGYLPALGWGPTCQDTGTAADYAAGDTKIDPFRAPVLAPINGALDLDW